MAVTISGDTGVSNISNANSLGNLGTARINPINAAPGSVIQVVQTVMSNTFNNSGPTLSEVSALNTSITPFFANSKILVLLDIKVGVLYYQVKGKLLRNGTGIALGDAAGTRPVSTFYSNNYYVNTGEYYSLTPTGSIFLDSPATTSPCVYSVQISSYTGSQAFVNRSYQWLDGGTGDYDATASSSMTLMEIRQ
jgi:hypothetical protein